MSNSLAYMSALWQGRNRSRAGLARHQNRLWHRLRSDFGRYAALRDYRHSDLQDLPVVSVEMYREKIQHYNILNLPIEQLNAPSSMPLGLSVGHSTGTSGGARGVFITSPTERALYTGQIMAKLLKPSQLLRVRKVALCLRRSDELYRSAGRLDMRFFPLGPDSAAAIAEFNPDLLIAPSQVLLALAAAHKLPDLKHLYYGAETLNDTERAFITYRLGVRPDPIYQATEGFLGAPCRLGTLHLNEDALIIEREPLPGGRFRPIVTDLLRRTQAIVRLRLDDILEPTTCLCGSVRAAVRPVEGRVQDIWRWPDRQVFPRDVEDHLAPLIPADHPWVATGHPNGIRLACRNDDAPRLAGALSVFGQPVEHVEYRADMDFPKRRHVRWQA